MTSFSDGVRISELLILRGGKQKGRFLGSLFFSQVWLLETAHSQGKGQKENMATEQNKARSQVSLSPSQVLGTVGFFVFFPQTNVFYPVFFFFFFFFFGFLSF